MNILAGNFRMDEWMKQVTTGHGAMIIGPTLLAVASGAMPWDVALPLLLAGIVGLIWPEGQRPPSGMNAEPLGVEAIISAYRLGIDHATQNGAPPKPGRPKLVPTAGAVGVLTAAGLSAAACVHPVETVRVVDVDTMATAGATRTARTTPPPSLVAAVTGGHGRAH